MPADLAVVKATLKDFLGELREERDRVNEWVAWSSARSGAVMTDNRNRRWTVSPIRPIGSMSDKNEKPATTLLEIPPIRVRMPGKHDGPDFPLGRAGVDFLESRGIDIEIAVRHLVHTVRADTTNKIMVPDVKGTVLAFPFIDHGAIVNVKYRATGKHDGPDFPLGRAGVDFLESREIDIEIAVRRSVHTVRADTTNKIMVPDAKGTMLAFPFIDHGAIVNVKCRATRSKKFWQSPGGKATFYNADIMDHPAIISGNAPLTIVEGELDALAVETAGVDAPDPRNDTTRLRRALLVAPVIENDGNF
jgi:hypothetical protein